MDTNPLRRKEFVKIESPGRKYQCEDCKDFPDTIFSFYTGRKCERKQSYLCARCVIKRC